MFKYVVLVMSLFVIAACGGKSTHGSKIIEQETKESVAQFIVKNKTTADEIRAKYGKPDMTGSQDDKPYWMYMYSESDVTLPASTYVGMIPIISLATMGMDSTPKISSKSTFLQIYFNPNNTVKDYEFSKSETKYGE